MAGNDALAAQPELINQDPYGQGWIARLKPGSAVHLRPRKVTCFTEDLPDPAAMI